MKEEVRIRSKQLRNGNRSLYLDIYHKGVRRYVFLRLYLLPETGAGAKAANEQTMRMAESIKAQRTLALFSGRHNLTLNNDRLLFFPIISALAAKHDAVWQIMVKHLRRYERHRNLTLASITKEWAKGFRAYLLSQPMKQNSRWAYWSKFVAAVNHLYAEGILSQDILKGVPSIQKESVERVFLTIPELHLLSSTPCEDDATRRLFLFSCLTGLRYSDCIALKWSRVEDTPQGCRIVFRQQKTGTLEYMSVNQQARELMGARSDDSVFPFRHPSTLNNRVQRWAKAAGLHKHISFHCARHTFATMLLSLGTDLYMVSRLLGHRSIATTQIYAHILDEEKRAAVEKIPRL